jgi:hypothetical protein
MVPEAGEGWEAAPAGNLPAKGAAQSGTEAEQGPEELEPKLMATGEKSQRRSPKTKSRLNVSHLYVVSRRL